MALLSFSLLVAVGFMLLVGWIGSERRRPYEKEGTGFEDRRTQNLPFVGKDRRQQRAAGEVAPASVRAVATTASMPLESDQDVRRVMGL
jgi:hypothetical protein